MANDNGLFSHESRRTFLKKGALASGVAVGLAGCSQIRGDEQAPTNETDTTTATETPTGDGDAGGGGKALMFNSEFNGGAQFRVVSDVLEAHPTVEGVQEGDIWSEYNTRMIEYLNTDENVTFFPAHDATVEQDQVYELHDNFTWFGDNVNDEGIIDVKFTQVGNEQVFAADNWEVVEQGGGKALVRWNNFRPGAVFTCVSGVVEWAPRADVQGSDIFSEYNTRLAEWLNTQNDFQIYVAQDAQVKKGAHYRMNKEFDVTEPEANLVTVDLDRVERAN